MPSRNPPNRGDDEWCVHARPPISSAMDRRGTASCYIVRDATGFEVAFVYYEEESGRRAAAKLMTQDEARRIAANIAKLPNLLRKG